MEPFDVSWTSDFLLLPMARLPLSALETKIESHILAWSVGFLWASCLLPQTTGKVVDFLPQVCSPYPTRVMDICVRIAREYRDFSLTGHRRANHHQSPLLVRIQNTAKDAGQLTHDSQPNVTAYTSNGSEEQQQGEWPCSRPGFRSSADLIRARRIAPTLRPRTFCKYTQNTIA